ncbi:hypothetical protein CYMTET_23131 [Cymbomonas tetramitiformis]|uniref:Uncharacterized protein n=1 Tax=Cymbomonas tetramitiformis TaxID=36881 RepID=A0AAE0FYF9_9CHLO|nr:hypothetical protein CYMTET_23131 [Cymbomonas tetramitiformis]
MSLASPRLGVACRDCDREEMLMRRCREMLKNSPTAMRLIKAAMNAAEDGHAGLQDGDDWLVNYWLPAELGATVDTRPQEMGGNATLLFYNSAEGTEGRTAYMEKRAPDWSRFKRLP